MATAHPELISRQPSGKRKAWRDLAVHYKTIRDVHLRQLFADDPGRGERLPVDAIGLFLDYSKNRITDDTVKLLIRLAGESHLRDRIDAMFRGQKINVTENRAVLHTALRAPRNASIVELGKVLAQRIIPELESQAEPILTHDSSTDNLIRHYRKNRKTA